MSETITSADVHNLGLFSHQSDSSLESSAQQVLVVANDPEYQRLMREFLAVQEDQIAQKADAMTALTDYAYAVGMPDGQRRDSLYVNAAFTAVLHFVNF